jgi:hypothetical protein
VFKPLLHLAFVISVLVNFAKASELVLDSSQQLRLQEFLNKVTERLIDLNILKWYPKLREFRYCMPIFLIVLGLEALLILHGSGKIRANHASGPGWLSWCLLAIVQFLFYWPIVQLLARVRSAWLFCACVVSPVFLLVRAYFFSIIVFAAWMKGIGEAYLPNASHYNPKVVLFLIVIGLIFFAVASLVFVLCVALTALGVVVSLCHAAVVIAREALWRIVTYAKGAWAALCILLTVVLGFLELLVRENKL